jgi:ACS family D-galactonate transporter-like MFS transporter
MPFVLRQPVYALRIVVSQESQLLSVFEPNPLSIARTSSAWRLVPLLLVMIATAHFNRISISVAGTEVLIKHEGINEKQMGWVYTAYLIVYTLGMSPGGWFIDRFGPRLALFVVGGGSAVFMALTGLSGLLWTGMSLWLGLLVIRSTMGIVNVPTHPGAARLVGAWIAPAQHSLVNGMVNFAACVGIALTYYVFGKLIDHFQWTGASFVAAVFTAVLAICWVIFARNDAAPPQNDAARETPPALPVAALWRNRTLVMLTLSYAALGYFQYLFFYWAQYYFEEIRKVDKDESRWYTSFLTLAMGLGMLAGGWITDFMRRRYAHRRIVALVPVVGLTLAALAMAPGLFSERPMMTLLCFALAMAAAGTSEGAFWTLAVEIGGTRGGLAAGILNTGGNAGGLIAPFLTPYLSEWFGWQAGFGVAGVCCLLAALCWIWIDPRERLEWQPRACI